MAGNPQPFNTPPLSFLPLARPPPPPLLPTPQVQNPSARDREEERGDGGAAVRPRREPTGRGARHLRADGGRRRRGVRRK